MIRVSLARGRDSPDGSALLPGFETCWIVRMSAATVLACIALAESYRVGLHRTGVRHGACCYVFGAASSRSDDFSCPAVGCLHSLPWAFQLASHCMQLLYQCQRSSMLCERDHDIVSEVSKGRNGQTEHVQLCDVCCTACVPVARLTYGTGRPGSMGGYAACPSYGLHLSGSCKGFLARDRLYLGNVTVEQVPFVEVLSAHRFGTCSSCAA